MLGNMVRTLNSTKHTPLQQAQAPTTRYLVDAANATPTHPSYHVYIRVILVQPKQEGQLLGVSVVNLGLTRRQLLNVLYRE
jgi:hypothetical protein